MLPPFKLTFWRRALLALGALLIIYQFWLLGHVLWWRHHNPSDSAFMREGLHRLQQQDPEAELEHTWVPYGQISPQLKAAVIAAEDARFLEHDGFDWEGIQAAWEKDLHKQRIVAGGSTISQQLAKNLFLSGRRTPWRKLEESAITLMLEHLMHKHRILEIYLNVIEWGDGVYGAEAASEHYFHIHARQLNTRQSAWLAAIIPNPRYFDTHRQDKRLLRKAAILRRRMGSVDIPR